MSRTVVREAIKVLASKGLVETRPKVGTQVRLRRYWNLLDSDVLAWRYEVGPDEGFLEDLSEVREIIEPSGRPLSAPPPTRWPRSSPGATRWRMPRPKTGTTTSTPTWPSTAILDACHNDLLAQLSDTITMVLRLSRRLTVSVPGSSLAAMPAHWAVARNPRSRTAGGRVRDARAAAHDRSGHRACIARSGPRNGVT